MQKSYNNPFFIFDRRAMISLGPLSIDQYCPYSCAFCYVQNGFSNYGNLSIDHICEYLEKNKELYDIIYISGDTDSFAPPRKNMGIDLLVTIAQKFDKDLWFSTRTTFSNMEMEQINKVNEILRKKHRLLFGCISITCPVTNQVIEPAPIPSIKQRIRQLKIFKENNLITVLQMRPLLPSFGLEEYFELIDKCHSFSDVILGERWYYDTQKIILKRVMGEFSICQGNVEIHKMDFDDNNINWYVWFDSLLEDRILEYCLSLGTPFYMRSAPAVKLLRELYS